MTRRQPTRAAAAKAKAPTSKQKAPAAKPKVAEKTKASSKKPANTASKKASPATAKDTQAPAAGRFKRKRTAFEEEDEAEEKEEEDEEEEEEEEEEEQPAKKKTKGKERAMVGVKQAELDEVDEQDPGQRAVEEAQRAAAEPVLFYGAERKDGFLSNMYIAEFEHNGMKFVCNEQYFQYAKAILFQDTIRAEEIMKTKSPKKHKSLGKKVKPFDAKKWGRAAPRVMLKAVQLKFTETQEHDCLRLWLFHTGERELVEASTNKVWGCGMTLEKAYQHYLKAEKKLEAPEWPGKNQLGEILMTVRKELGEKERLEDERLEAERLAEPAAEM